MVYAPTRMRQQSLFPKEKPPVHGGELALGKRKCSRPLARRRPIHLILKSKTKLYPKRIQIESETHRLATKFGLRIYEITTAHDHLHIALLIPSRANYSKFIRALTGLLARKLGKGLWCLLPFTRVLHWGRDFLQTKKYIQQNREEAAGRQPYKPRKNWYSRFGATH